MPLFKTRDRLRKGSTRAEDAHGTPTHSHISPSILVYEDKRSEQVWYQVELLADGSAVESATLGNVLTYSTENLVVGTVYTGRTRAVNALQAGDWVSPAALTALILPNVISNLNVSCVSGTSLRSSSSLLLASLELSDKKVYEPYILSTLRPQTLPFQGFVRPAK